MQGESSQKDFYNCLIEWAEGNTSYLLNFWTWAESIGEAVKHSCEGAEKLEIKNPIAVCIDFYDFEELPDEVITVVEQKTFAGVESHSFATEYCYRLPAGVIMSFEDGEFDATEIETGFDIVEYEDNLLEIEAVVEADKLLEVYFELISGLPEIRVFWLKFQPDWEAEDLEELFINEAMTTVGQIRNFIEKNRIDTLQNGHLTLTTYWDEGQTNINISDHKSLVILTYDKEIAEKSSQILRKNGLAEKESLVCVSRGFHHWHYRHYLGMDRLNLIEKLQKQGFVKWENN